MLIKVGCRTAQKHHFFGQAHITCVSVCWEGAPRASSLLEQFQLLSSLILQMKKLKQRVVNLPQVIHLVSGGTVI